ncbi:MAG: ribosome silencing factor [Gemmatimonadales bacterium]|uniref:ribosome silencing factor n=1 Tax=Candidatus Palauibacter TaxID=3056650 RepID=UPI00137CD21A|nr:ribosome silencing factor [Candidatus Palauibacter polyketidifaciens]MDE2721444.1 ribosome silencing factor [Candidatus Palauibacter polyketidifaciens]MXX67580.1 ribosome silencing factor [Gemmatimonadales bacterium]MYE34997.1 ribosome silencing factor [Gemmatimonadales bacterium]MYG19480.1 ribosome silencing factor [Gemmatimonadales bacterium]
MTHGPLPLEEVWRRLSERGDPSPELRSVAEAALERNARLPTILDLRGLSDVTDFFVIATGDSDTHARAISENILDRTREDGFRPVGVEGLNKGRWVLMDYVGLIVHVFLGEVREFYRLERLWGDAPLFELE